LSYNNISVLRDVDMQFLAQDIKLNLSNNNIVEVDLKSLEHMVLSQDNLDVAPKVHVFLQANPLMCNCLLLDFVKYLQNELSPSVKKVYDISVDNLKCAGPGALTGRYVATLKELELTCPLDSNNTAIPKCPSQCKCEVRIADMTLVVNCANAKLTKVPELPERTGLSSIELNIQNNSITRLPLAGSPGYANVTKIYAQNNNISLLLRENIPASLQVLEIANNQLSFINTTVLEGLNATKQLHSISLSNNPWTCTCDTLDLLTFVQTRYKVMSDFDSIKCSGSGKKFSSLKPGEMCPTNQELLIVLCICFVMLVVLISAITIFYYKYEQEIKVWMFAHHMCLWCVSEEELDKDKKYDAFVSYSQKDEDIAHQLVSTLESGPNPHKLCVHVRDWSPGEWIQEQVRFLN
jgi:protein toll